ESIRIYGLDRPQLVTARQAVAMRLLAHLKITKQAIELRIEMPSNQKAMQHAEDCLNELENFIKPKAPYLGMCRQILKKEFPQAL
ncbi:MAG TPA: hypothetical protein VHA06_07545, partial [Candidatus Angelobacter sp.]|nr:hypothetical protein [Candidatus Angelobacter sp.]